VGAAMMDWFSEEKLGVSSFVSMGNRADVDEADLIDYFNHDENTEVIAAFLQEHSEFIVTDCRQYLPDSAAPMVTPAGFFAPTPADGLDGFFGARLERTQSSG